VRNIRKLLGFSTKKKEYYKLGNVNEIFSSSGKMNKNKKTKKTKNKPRKNKKQTMRKKIKKDIKLLYFYMDGCKWCKKFGPLWSKLKKSIKDVKFMKINGPINHTMKDKYKVKTYPALVKVENKKHELFEGERSFKNLKDFLK